MPKLAFFFILFLFSESQAGKLSHLIHQLKSEEPCWEISEADLAPLLNRNNQCRASNSPMAPMDRVTKPFHGTAQALVFELAAHEYKKASSCLKGVFQLLKNKELNSELHQYWIKATASSLAYSFQKEGRIARLNVAQAKKNHRLNELSQDASLSIDEFQNAITDENTAYEKEARREKKSAQEYFEKAPFIEHPEMKKFVRKMKDEILPESLAQRPSDQKIIQGKIEKYLRQHSSSLFSNLIQDFETDFRIDPAAEEDRKQLLKHGFVEAALTQTLGPEHSLHRKLSNCAQGDYGSVSERIENTQEAAAFIAGGFVGAARRTVATSVTGIALGTAKASWRFAMGGLFGLTWTTAPNDIEKSCLGKGREYFPLTKEAPNCENPKDLKDFALKWMEVKSCEAAALSAL